MQELTEKVYECTLAVEAHMICDLLARAGISARVDGAFLSGAGGELPLGNTVKVRVEPARATEAREVIADWEKQQPPDAAGRKVVQAPRFMVAVCALRARRAQPWQRRLGASLRFSIPVHQVGVHGLRLDRWRERCTLDLRLTDGDPVRADDDFDGRFEWRADGRVRQRSARSVLDTNGDGRPNGSALGKWRARAHRLPLRQRRANRETGVLQVRSAGLRRIR